MKEKIPLSILTALSQFQEKYPDLFVIEMNNSAQKENTYEAKIMDKETKEFSFSIKASNKSTDVFVAYNYDVNKITMLIPITGLLGFLSSWSNKVVEYKKQYEKIIPSNTIIKQSENNNIPITKSFITEFTIFDFKRLAKIQLKFSKQLDIILGKNSYGKTSLLQALALALLPENDLDSPRTEQILGYINKKNTNCFLNAMYNDLTVKTLLLDKISVPNIARAAIKRPALLLAYAANIFYNKQSQNKYIEITEELIFGKDKWYHVKSIFENYYDGCVDPLDVLNRLYIYEKEDFKGQKTVILQIQTWLVEFINYLLPENSFELKLQDSVYSFVDAQGEKFTTDELSEGFRTNIVLFADILMRMIALRGEMEKLVVTENFDLFNDTYGVVLIDEFDRHLHPSWQKELLNKLKEKLPKVQWILTTHNPMSILDRDENEIHKLDLNEDGDVIVEKIAGGSKKMDIVQVLLEYFDAHSVVSQTLQQKIDDYYRQRLLGESAEKLAALAQELKESYVGLTIPDERYLKYLQFLQEKDIDVFKNIANHEELSEKEQEELSKLLEF
jgi:predicted ATP-binding protein involved in virulence